MNLDAFASEHRAAYAGHAAKRRSQDQYLRYCIGPFAIGIAPARSASGTAQADQRHSAAHSNRGRAKHGHAIRRPARMDRRAAERGRAAADRRRGRLGLRAWRDHPARVRQRRRAGGAVQQHQGLQQEHVALLVAVHRRNVELFAHCHDVRPAEGRIHHRFGEGRSQESIRAACRRSPSRPAR